MQKLKNVCAYCRVSTDSAEQNKSYEAQKEYFKQKLSKENGYKLVEIYADEGISGTKLSSKREAFNQMLYDAGLELMTNHLKVTEIRKKYISYDYVLSDREPKFNLIYVKDSSRFARNTEVIRIINRLRDKGVYIYFEDLNKSTENSQEMMLIEFSFTISAEESKKTSSRVRWGSEQSAKKGNIRRKNGVFGYTYNTETERMEANADAEIIKYIYQMYLEGLGIRRIVNRLNSEGFTNIKNNKFNDSNVGYILKNKTYAGFVIRNKFSNLGLGDSAITKRNKVEDYLEFDNNKIDRIISEEDFNKVQELMAGRITNNNVGSNNGCSAYAKKIKCALCGSYYNIVYKYNEDKTKQYIYYRCYKQKKEGRGACKAKTIKLEDLDRLINEHIKSGYYKNKINGLIKFVKFSITNIEEEINNKIIENKKLNITEINDKIEEYRDELKVYFTQLSNSSKIIRDMAQENIDRVSKLLEPLEALLDITNTEQSEIVRKMDSIKKDLDRCISYVKTQAETYTKEDFIKYNLLYITISEDGTLSPIFTVYQELEEIIVRLCELAISQGLEFKVE